jgi:hypothetical protein
MGDIARCHLRRGHGPATENIGFRRPFHASLRQLTSARAIRPPQTIRKSIMDTADQALKLATTMWRDTESRYCVDAIIGDRTIKVILAIDLLQTLGGPKVKLLQDAFETQRKKLEVIARRVYEAGEISKDWTLSLKLEHLAG